MAFYCKIMPIIDFLIHMQSLWRVWVILVPPKTSEWDNSCWGVEKNKENHLFLTCLTKKLCQKNQFLKQWIGGISQFFESVLKYWINWSWL